MATGDHTTTASSTRRSTKAQAIVELAVFGSILIFVISSIFQQGYATMMYQQGKLQPMRQALLESYKATLSINKLSPPATFRKNAVSVFIVEDRLYPGMAKYGTQDRSPVIMSGSGSLSSGLFYPQDWSDVYESGSSGAPNQTVLSVMDLYVNGQHFELSAAIAYYLRLRKKGPGPGAGEVTLARISGKLAPPCDPGIPIHPAQEDLDRLKCEWKPGNAYPTFFTYKVPGNTGYTNAEYNEQYNYNRNYTDACADILTDDLWNQTPTLQAERVELAAWKWIAMQGSDLASSLDSDTTTLAGDFNGDRVEETSYPKEDAAASTCPATGDQVFDIAIVDHRGGDMTAEGAEAYPSAADTPGIKAESSIYTEMQDGTVMEIRNGKSFIPGTDKLAMSVNKKHQLDVISRVWQLNRQMVDPGSFVRRNSLANGGGLEVACGNPDAYPLPPAGHGGCCMSTDPDPVNHQPYVLQTCFDQGQRTLYIRSRIRDDRGKMWINTIDTDQTNKLLGRI